MENHPQRNHPPIQTATVSAASSATTFSSGENKLSRSPMPSIASWTLGPGPIKPPVLILPDAPAEKVSLPPSRLRLGGLLIAPEPAHVRKTTKSKAIWTMASILAVLGVIVGVTWINTKAVADVMLFQVSQTHSMQSISGGGIVFPRQRFDLSYPAAEQVREVLVKAGDLVMPDQALIRLSQHGLLTSPIRGIVTAVNIDPGEIFPPDRLLLTIMDETAAIVHTQLPLAMFEKVTTGLSAQVTSSVLPGRTFEGTVSAIIPQADPQTSTFEVWVRIDNQREVLLPGTKVTVRILRAQ